MKSWIINLLQGGRIKATTLQLEAELETLSPEDAASVVVTAMAFCMKFLENQDGDQLATVLLRPSMLAPSDAGQLYGQLEDLLLIQMQRNRLALEQAKQRLGDRIGNQLSREYGKNETALRLLLTRIAVAAGRVERGKLSKVVARLDASRPHLRTAVMLHKKMDGMLGQGAAELDDDEMVSVCTDYVSTFSR